MAQVRTLLEIVQELASLDDEATIYAAEPWTIDAKALVAKEPSSGGLPSEALASGLTYFIEVFIAVDFLDDWCSTLDHAPSALEKCQRLIRYAINDA